MPVTEKVRQVTDSDLQHLSNEQLLLLHVALIMEIKGIFDDPLIDELLNESRSRCRIRDQYSQ